MLEIPQMKHHEPFSLRGEGRKGKKYKKINGLKMYGLVCVAHLWTRAGTVTPWRPILGYYLSLGGSNLLLGSGFCLAPAYFSVHPTHLPLPSSGALYLLAGVSPQLGPGLSHPSTLLRAPPLKPHPPSHFG